MAIILRAARLDLRHRVLAGVLGMMQFRAALWFLVGFLLSAVPMLVCADDYPPVRMYRFYSDSVTPRHYGPDQFDRMSACLDGFLWVKSRSSKPDYYLYPDLVGDSCRAVMVSGMGPNNWDYDPISTQIINKCPGGGIRQRVSTNPDVYMCVNAPPCAPNETRDEFGLCMENPTCDQGDAVTVVAGVGYALTTENVDDWINPVIPTWACHDGCRAANLSIIEDSCETRSWESGPPYPGYCEFTGVLTGAFCSNDNMLPPIPCPEGYNLGEVNGVPGCYPAGDGGGDPDPGDPDPGDPDPDDPDPIPDPDDPNNPGGNHGGGTGGGNGGSGTGGNGGDGGSGGGGGNNPGGDGNGVGSGDGDGDGEGEGECEGDDCGPGAPGEIGELYSKKDKTWGTVLTDFRQKVSDAPFAQAADGFFTVSASGSCPVWRTTLPMVGTITIDHFCQSWALMWLQIAGYAVLAAASFAAFRWAFL